MAQKASFEPSTTKKIHPGVHVEGWIEYQTTSIELWIHYSLLKTYWLSAVITKDWHLPTLTINRFNIAQAAFNGLEWQTMEVTSEMQQM